MARWCDEERGVRLFIENEPFSVEIYPGAPPIRQVEVRLRIALTKPTVLHAPPASAALPFVLDTAADYANVFPETLAAFGIPLEGPSGGYVRVILMDGSEVELPRRDVTLWLYSNIPALEHEPYRIELNGGVVVLPAPDPDIAAFVKPLLGMNPLVDAVLRLELNAQTRRFSVWVP